jgi:sulfite reductase alpha subunit-like flavoprotein
LFPLKDSEEVISESILLQPAWLLSTTKDVPSTATAEGQLALRGEQHSAVRLNVKVESNRRVTSQNHWQDVRHLEFSTESQLDYAPGDILEIQPKNPPNEVQQLLELLGWHEMADNLVGFSCNPNYPAIPATRIPVLHPYRTTTTMTLRQILTECIDINGIPKRSFFRLIAHFSNDDFQRERLEEFANPELTDELFDYTTRPRRSILEVLQEFDTVKIPWQWLFEIFPPLRPRQFSIASGGDLKVDTRGFTRFELLVAIVKYRTVIRKLRRGTCTRYLEDLEPGAALDVALVRGSLGINRKHAHIPLLMVGPGTGVAPLRALLWEKRIWERSYKLESSASNLAPDLAAAHSGSNILLFGCRNAASDFFFKEEWDRLKTSIPLTVFVAFSRDQQQKVYVQDLLLKQKQLVFDMLYHEGGFICVCGSSGKMPAAVRATLTDIFEENLGCPRAEAEGYLRAMEKAERYKQETW